MVEHKTKKGFHLKMQIPVKSIQVTVYEWALEFMHTKKKKSFLFFKIDNIFIISFFFLSFIVGIKNTYFIESREIAVHLFKTEFIVYK